MNAHSINQTCRNVGISRTTLYKLIREGRGPKITKLNRRSLIFDDDLRDWREALR